MCPSAWPQPQGGSIAQCQQPRGAAVGCRCRSRLCLACILTLRGGPIIWQPLPQLPTWAGWAPPLPRQRHQQAALLPESIAAVPLMHN